MTTYFNQRYALLTNAPPVPVVTVTNATTNSVTFTWPANMTNVAGFLIERATSTNGPFTIIGTLTRGTETNFTDYTLSSGLSYVYELVAINMAGASSVSQIVSRFTNSTSGTLNAYMASMYGTTLTDNGDYDQDGLPDSWEVYYHLNPLSAIGLDGAGGNPSGDGITNLLHYNQGTDPQAGGPNGTNTTINLQFYTPLQ